MSEKAPFRSCLMLVCGFVCLLVLGWCTPPPPLLPSEDGALAEVRVDASGREWLESAAEPVVVEPVDEVPVGEVQKESLVERGVVCQVGQTLICAWSGLGECGKGLRVCVEGGRSWGKCQPTVSRPEVCDGKDNDCDGEVDEDWKEPKACEVGVGACRRAGLMRCRPSLESVVCEAGYKLPAKELCDGVDNDCDGEVDEDWKPGSACFVGVGACKREGKWRCTADAKGARCDAKASLPQIEVCDGKDNDCDGKIDVRPCFPKGAVGCSQVGGVWKCEGSCATGEQRCVGGQWSETCTAATLPQAKELCYDKVDNDCDGVVDEGCCAPTKLVYHTKLTIPKLSYPLLWRSIPIRHDLKWVAIPREGSVVMWVRPSTGVITQSARSYTRHLKQEKYHYTIDAISGVFHPKSSLMAFATTRAVQEVSATEQYSLRKRPVVLIDVVKNQLVRVLETPFAYVSGRHFIAFSQDGSQCVLIEDNLPEGKGIHATVWRSSDGKVLSSFQANIAGHTGSSGIFGVAFHPQRKTILTGGNALREWRISDGKLLRTSLPQSGSGGSITDFKYHPKKPHVAYVNMGVGKTVIYNSLTDLLARKVLPLHPHRTGLVQGRYSPNGVWFAMYSRNTLGLKLMRTDTYREFAQVLSPMKSGQSLDQFRILGLRWSEDSKMLLTVDLNDIRMWQCP